MSEYKYLSDIYDRSMNLSNINYDKWYEKISHLIGYDRKNIKNILELGCGTGNITTKLLENNYEVVGIDKSYEMLQIAEKKTEKYGNKIILLQQDISDIEFEIYEIDMILAVNDVINYITYEEDLKNLFAFANEHIRKDGLFVFDISSSYKIKNILSNNTFFEEDDEYCMIWQNMYDDNTKIIDMYIDIFKQNKDDLYERYQEDHTQRAYEEEEIENMLKDAGFEKIEKEYFYKDEQIERIFFKVRK